MIRWHHTLFDFGALWFVFYLALSSMTHDFLSLMMSQDLVMI
jgi:hypothetical protein